MAATQRLYGKSAFIVSGCKTVRVTNNNGVTMRGDIVQFSGSELSLKEQSHPGKSGIVVSGLHDSLWSRERPSVVFGFRMKPGILSFGLEEN